MSHRAASGGFTIPIEGGLTNGSTGAWPAGGNPSIVDETETMSLEDDFAHKYVAILRCATWHVWAEHTRVMSGAISISTGTNEGG